MGPYYFRVTEFPTCKDCRCTLDWYDWREDWSTYQCDECSRKEMKKKIEAIVERAFAHLKKS